MEVPVGPPSLAGGSVEGATWTLADSGRPGCGARLPLLLAQGQTAFWTQIAAHISAPPMCGAFTGGNKTPDSAREDGRD